MKRYVIALIGALLMIAPLALSRLGPAQAREQTTQTPEKPKGDVEAGKKLYAEQCIKCHGDKGEGVLGLYKHAKATIVPLGSEQAQQKSDEEIRKSMADGFEKLTREDIENLLAFLRTLKREPSQAPAKPTQTQEKAKGDVEAGKALYVKQCQRCHGANGEGVPRMYRVVGAKIVHLGSQGAQEKSDDFIRKSMTDGCCKPTNKMQAIKELTPEQIENILAFTRTLKQ